METLKTLVEENLRLREVANTFEKSWKNSEAEVKRLEGEISRLREVANKFKTEAEAEAECERRLKEDNLRLIEEVVKFEELRKKTEAEYEKKSGAVDQLLGLIENWRADISSKTELKGQVDSVNSKLAQVESSMQQMQDRLSAFDGRITSAEAIQTVIQTPSSTDDIVESEEAKRRKAADYIESRLEGIQKENVELQNMAIAVMNAYLSHLGLYAMLFTVGSLLFEKHVSCESAQKIGIGAMVGFAAVLGSQVYSYDCKIRVIGRAVKALMRKVPALRGEAETLANNLRISTGAERQGGFGSSSTPGTSSWLASINLRWFMIMRHLYCRTRIPDENHVQDQFVKRVDILARQGGLEKGLEKFTCNCRWQMILPAVFILIVFGGLMFSIYEYCDKASKAPLSSILDT